MNAYEYIVNRHAVAMKALIMTLLTVSLLIFGGLANAMLVVNDAANTAKKDLIAGQSIDAGDVTVQVEDGNLVVTLQTTGGWELVEAHLWTGQSLSGMPVTKSGNPKIGNFPYLSGSIAGATSFSFEIPITSLAVSEEALCGVPFLMAAHASVRKADGSGGFQSETAWGMGSRLVEKGNWAMYFGFSFACIDQPPVGADCNGHETAYAFGNTPFTAITNTATGDPITTSRWGWQITVEAGSALEKPIYAGAGKNDISKGTQVGVLRVNYDGKSAVVEYEMFDDFFMMETQLYVGASNVQTVAPGQYGNQNQLGFADYDSYVVDIAGNTIYVVAHAVVCSPKWAK